MAALQILKVECLLKYTDSVCTNVGNTSIEEIEKSF